MLGAIIAILVALLILNHMIDMAATRVSPAAIEEVNLDLVSQKRTSKSTASNNFVSLRDVWPFVLGVLLNQGAV